MARPAMTRCRLARPIAARMRARSRQSRPAAEPQRFLTQFRGMLNGSSSGTQRKETDSQRYFALWSAEATMAWYSRSDNARRLSSDPSLNLPAVTSPLHPRRRSGARNCRRGVADARSPTKSLETSPRPNSSSDASHSYATRPAAVPIPEGNCLQPRIDQPFVGAMEKSLLTAAAAACESDCSVTRDDASAGGDPPHPA